jgi:hypothetical protein
MSIVIDLQKHIIQNKKTPTELLREALLISTKLKLDNFKIWIGNELKGYSSRDEMPSYRIISGEVKFFNPYQGWQSIPADIAGLLNETTANTLYFHQSIAELEDLILKKDSESLAFSFPEDLASTLRKALNINVKFAIFTHTSTLASIIEQVKTTLLEWTLKLEENQILGDENMSFSHEEQDKAQKSIHIENFNGVIGNIDNLGNLSTGDYNRNTTTINNNINSKIDELIKKINTLDITDKSQVIQKIEENRNDKKKLIELLGQLITRGSEIATIAPVIGELLKMLG